MLVQIKDKKVGAWNILLEIDLKCTKYEAFNGLVTVFLMWTEVDGYVISKEPLEERKTLFVSHRLFFIGLFALFVSYQVSLFVCRCLSIKITILIKVEELFVRNECIAKCNTILKDLASEPAILSFKICWRTQLVAIWSFILDFIVNWYMLRSFIACDHWSESTKHKSASISTFQWHLTSKSTFSVQKPCFSFTQTTF